MGNHDDKSLEGGERLIQSAGNDWVQHATMMYTVIPPKMEKKKRIKIAINSFSIFFLGYYNANSDPHLCLIGGCIGLGRTTNFWSKLVPAAGDFWRWRLWRTPRRVHEASSGRERPQGNRRVKGNRPFSDQWNSSLRFFWVVFYVKIIYIFMYIDIYNICIYIHRYLEYIYT